MRKFLIGLAAALTAAAVSTAQGTETYTKETTVRTFPAVSGEVLRYEPGKSIIIRQPDGQAVTYTIGPALVVPADVQVGRRVTVFTEPSDSGSVRVTRITTVTTGGTKQTTVETTTADPPAITGARTSTHEVSVQDPTTGSRTTTTTKTTTITGDVVRIEPGRAILLRSPDDQVVTYTLAPGLTIPAKVQVGSKVTIFTEPSDSGRVIVTRVTTVTSGGAEAVREATLDTPGGMQTRTRKIGTTGEAKSEMTTVFGTVTVFEPGRTITVVSPKRTTVTYVLDRESEIPSDLAVGKTVTIRTTRAVGSQQPLVRKVTYTTRTQTSKKRNY